jgi:predicted DsbA family dithiol-disulfide isomerase
MWTEGRDVGDRGVLEAIAADAGLPDGFVVETLEDESSAETPRAAFEAARERGVTGVPTFAYDGYAARGAVPPEQFRRLIEGS